MHFTIQQIFSLWHPNASRNVARFWPGKCHSFAIHTAWKSKCCAHGYCHCPSSGKGCLHLPSRAGEFLLFTGAALPGPGSFQDLAPSLGGTGGSPALPWGWALVGWLLCAFPHSTAGTCNLGIAALCALLPLPLLSGAVLQTCSLGLSSVPCSLSVGLRQTSPESIYIVEASALLFQSRTLFIILALSLRGSGCFGLALKFPAQTASGQEPG